METLLNIVELKLELTLPCRRIMMLEVQLRQYWLQALAKGFQKHITFYP
jgi:hypothetical protein